jgi:hypothetical protein
MNAGRILIGMGAGLVSAVLLATIVTGNTLAFILVCLSPLPLVIVGLGWSWLAAISGSLIASLALGAVTNPAVGLVYFLGVGGPAAWLSYMALLGRPALESSDPAVQSAGGTEWYPIGRIVGWLAIVAALLGTAFLLNLGFSLEAYLSATRASTEGSLRLLERLGMFRPPGPGPERDLLLRFFSLMVPVALSAMAFLVMVFNIWLGGRIVVRSGRSPRPWPDVATLELPRNLLFVYLAALALSFAGPDLIGVIAGLFATTLTFAYAMQGLAVLHFVTRGLAARFLILIALYLALIVVTGPVLVPLAVLGLIEPLIKLRARAAARRRGST